MRYLIYYAAYRKNIREGSVLKRGNIIISHFEELRDIYNEIYKELKTNRDNLNIVIKNLIPINDSSMDNFKGWLLDF